MLTILVNAMFVNPIQCMDTSKLQYILTDAASMLLSPVLRTQSSVSHNAACSSQPQVPRLILTDINSELDELDREEFYRLKKVAGKKQRDTAAEDEELKVRKEAQEAARKALSSKDNKAAEEAKDATEPADLLAEGDDDVIF